ncbi:MAG: hypothetical protein ACYS5V_16550 [Planctomycetota bacterium]|jgi:hypothetical protein
MKCLAHCVILSMVVVCLARLGIAQPADRSRGSGAGELPLAGAPVTPIPEMSLDQIADAFPVWPHRPFSESGFRPHVLPLRYRGGGPGADRHEALAGSCLIALALEWAPACCEALPSLRYPRRDRGPGEAAYYSRPFISALSAQLGLTHVVGGELVRDAKGYGGTVEVYDANGRQIRKRTVKGGQNYFDVIGSMAVEAMKALGYTPTDELSAFLRSRRCSRKSVLDLGRASVERGKARGGLHEAILRRDPGFAELRAWRSDTVHRQQQYNELDRAMNAGVTIQGIRRFDHRALPSRRTIAKVPGWLDRAEKMIGADHPAVLATRLRWWYWARKAPPAAMRQRALAAAAKYPRATGLVQMVGHIHSGDPRMPMLVPYGYCLWQLNLLGRPGLTLAMLDLFGATPEKLAEALSNTPLYRAEACFATGRYSQAADAALLRTRWRCSGETKARMLGLAGISAVLGGKADLCRQILRDRRAEIAGTGMPELLQAYLDLAAGRKLDIAAMKKLARHERNWWYRQEVLLYAQAELLQGTNAFRGELVNAIRLFFPDYRPLWILYDAYDRRDPKPEAVPFYDSLEWLHGGDEWVRRAVADARKRRTDWRIPSADRIMRVLADVEPKRYCECQDPTGWQAWKKYVYALPLGGVAATARQALREGKGALAEELALRYHHMAVETGGDLQTYASHLVHVVEHARRRAATTAPATRPAGT